MNNARSQKASARFHDCAGPLFWLAMVIFTLGFIHEAFAKQMQPPYHLDKYITY